ncbi:hypothetical protein [Sporosarcina aquimarina]|uniref:hypothetical protein n=1 Tax=Sporosarcina aquimarina TaxID=114975 RepID=UPI0020423420|nr:hypothetical protein [Sporosarcina aquimarina]
MFLLSYGCDLDHSNIDFLVKERLMPFAIKREDKTKRRNVKDLTIHLMYDVYDVNWNKHEDNKYYLEEFLISETHLLAFEYSLSKLKGNHSRCRPYARGHYDLTINEKEYSLRVYQKLSGDKELFFIDEESLHNTSLRIQNHKLPRELQWLLLTTEIETYEREAAIIEWIQTVLNSGRRNS